MGAWLRSHNFGSRLSRADSFEDKSISLHDLLLSNKQLLSMFAFNTVQFFIHLINILLILYLNLLSPEL